MEKRPAKLSGVVLVCLSLGSLLAIPLNAVFRSSLHRAGMGIPQQLELPGAAARSTSCSVVGAGGYESYDSNSGRCVQGSSGCAFAP